MKLAVNMLEHSPRVNVRSALDKATIVRYVEAYQAGEIFEPVIVFQERGTERYVIADGSHRTEAAKQAGVTEIDVDIREGDETDALKFALRCNAKHGLLRRDGDVLACIRSLMLDTVLSEQYQTHQERADLLCMSYKTFQRHFAKWRMSKGGNREERALKEEMQERAEKATPSRSAENVTEKPAEVVTCPPPETVDQEPPKPTRKSEPKPPMTPEQKKIAKEVRESEKRERKARTQDQQHEVEAQNAIDATRAFPHDGREGAKRWSNITTEHARYMRAFWSEFVAEREGPAKDKAA